MQARICDIVHVVRVSTSHTLNCTCTTYPCAVAMRIPSRRHRRLSYCTQANPPRCRCWRALWLPSRIPCARMCSSLTNRLNLESKRVAHTPSPYDILSLLRLAVPEVARLLFEGGCRCAAAATVCIASLALLYSYCSCFGIECP